ncbi:MAG: hypothetical protein AAB573_05350 [Patescibacteria group bacterium]
MRYFFSFALLVLVALAHPTHALVPTLGVAVEVVSEPRNPRPGQSVIIRANLIGSNTARASIRFESGGKVLAEGVPSITITAPDRGQTRDITVSAITENGASGETVFTLAPQDVSLVYESESTVPPFSSIRPLGDAHSNFAILAVPDLIENGTRVSNRDVYYEWSVNGSIRKSLSGYGRSLITLEPPTFNAPFTVRILATSRAGDTAERVVTISPRAPSVVIYESGPLSGVETQRAVIGVHQFPNEETAFIAYPLYVKNWRDLIIRWTLNGTPVDLDTEDVRTATFRKTGAGSGSYQVGVEYTHPTRFFEEKKQTFLLNF